MEISHYSYHVFFWKYSINAMLTFDYSWFLMLYCIYVVWKFNEKNSHILMSTEVQLFDDLYRACDLHFFFFLFFFYFLSIIKHNGWESTGRLRTDCNIIYFGSKSTWYPSVLTFACKSVGKVGKQELKNHREQIWRE